VAAAHAAGQDRRGGGAGVASGRAADVDAAARVATSATQAAAYAANAAERAAVVAAPKHRPSLLDQAESWGVSAWGEELKGAGEVDARVHARTGLRVVKIVDAAP